MRSLPDLVEEMPAEGIPEGIEDLADFLLSTLGGAIAKLVDEEVGVDGGQKTYRSRLVITDLRVLGRTVTLASN